MKKTFLYIAAALSLVSCIEDSRENNMVPDSVSLVFDEVVVPVSVYSGAKEISVLKSGKGTSPAWAKVGFSSEGLAKYNADDRNDATYKELASSLVKFSTEKVDFQPSDVRQLLSVSWTVDDMVKAISGDDYVVPVGLLGSDITVNEGRDLILLNILNSTASFASSGSTVMAKETSTENGEVTLKIKLDHVMPIDLSVNFAVDNSLVAAYNTEKGTNYTTAPNGYVQIPSEGAVINAGASDVFAKITLKTSVLYGQDGKISDFRTHLIPIKITGTSVNGVKVSESAYYLLVNNPLAGASFSRVWGLYSASSNWTNLYETIPAGGDRTLATDGTWVYLPYAVGSSEAKITAISVTDPETTKMVNFTGATANTITSACVRVIDKGNGTKMLLASGANASEFAFYAWENGIDNPPTKFGLKCSWRRHGDRFEYHGTWADGQMWSHSYQGRFSSYYEFKDGAFVDLDPKYGHLLIDLNYTGFGGPYWYPGSDEILFTTSDAGAFVTLTGATHIADVFTVKDTSCDDYNEATLTFGYNVFTFRGEEYVAYVSYDKDLLNSKNEPYSSLMRARLTVLKGMGDWRKTLDEATRTVVFEAPLQGENFEDVAFATSATTVGDCSVYVASDHVIIAAGMQGIGLSVFKME